MIYTTDNCHSRALVVDGITGACIDNVMSIDTDAKTITRCEMPRRLVNDGFSSFTRGFESVKISNDASGLPTLFEVRGLQP